MSNTVAHVIPVSDDANCKLSYDSCHSCWSRKKKRKIDQSKKITTVKRSRTRHWCTNGVQERKFFSCFVYKLLQNSNSLQECHATHWIEPHSYQRPTICQEQLNFLQNRKNVNKSRCIHFSVQNGVLHWETHLWCDWPVQSCTCIWFSLFDQWPLLACDSQQWNEMART